jgi:hypothetical protein
MSVESTTAAALTPSTTPAHKGYSEAELRPVFDALHGPNWKDPFRAEIQAGPLFVKASAACEFYTGAGLKIVGHYTDPLGRQIVVAECAGYYATVGA